MKNLFTGILFAAAVLAMAPAVRAAGTNSVASTQLTPYPLNYCVVSGDKLGGDMGPPIEFIYQNQAKGINQEIKFCCPMCKPQFLQDPDKFMKIIQNAETGQAKPAK
jgi:hypothetical protein